MYAGLTYPSNPRGWPPRRQPASSGDAAKVDGLGDLLAARIGPRHPGVEVAHELLLIVDAGRECPLGNAGAPPGTEVVDGGPHHRGGARFDAGREHGLVEDVVRLLPAAGLGAAVV